MAEDASSGGAVRLNPRISVLPALLKPDNLNELSLNRLECCFEEIGRLGFLATGFQCFARTP